MTTVTPADELQTLLLIGSGHRPYREYALPTLASRYRIVLLDHTAPTWQQPHLAAHQVADLHDPEAVRAAVAAIRAEHVLHGVVTWDEFSTVTAARIARDLDLPGPDPEAVARCRNKAACRRALDAAGVPSAVWRHATDLDGVRAAAQHIGYPLVLKPSAAGGSMGVIRVDSDAELASAYRFTARACSGQGGEGTGMLVESYLDGRELSAEVVTHHGHHQVVAVTTKLLGAEPYFEEVGHLIDGTSASSHPAAAVATAALDALGVTCGVFHVELRMTSTGPRIIEVNPRIGGDLIGHLVNLATGVDLAIAAGDVAAGHTPDLTATRSRAAGIRFVYPHVAGRLRSIELAPAIAAAPWCERAVLTQRPGDRVAPPPGGGLESRLGHLITVAPTAEQCRAHLDQAADGVRADVTPTGEGR